MTFLISNSCPNRPICYDHKKIDRLSIKSRDSRAKPAVTRGTDDDICLVLSLRFLP